MLPRQPPAPPGGLAPVAFDGGVGLVVLGAVAFGIIAGGEGLSTQVWFRHMDAFPQSRSEQQA